MRIRGGSSASDVTKSALTSANPSFSMRPIKLRTEDHRWIPQDWQAVIVRNEELATMVALGSVALSLSVVLAVPDFRRVVVPSDAVALTCAVVVAWIFVLTRAIEPTLNVVSRYTRIRKQARRFVVTPLEQQCHWSIARQPDGSYITQFAAHFLIRNRLSASLYPTDARLIRPEVRGELMPNPTLVIGSLDDRTYGTAAVSSNHIPAGATLPVSCVIMIRGMPKQRSGRLPATIEIKESNGHCERVKVDMVYVSAPGTTQQVGSSV